MCGLGPGSPWQGKQPQTRVSAPVIWQLIGLCQMYQARPAPTWGPPPLSPFCTPEHWACCSVKNLKLRKSYRILITLLCAPLDQSAIHQVSDSASWGCCKPHGVMKSAPTQTDKVRCVSENVPGWMSLPTPAVHNAVASDQTNIQAVSAELCTWAGRSIQTHTEVLNHNTRIMNESSNTRTPQESLPHRFVFLMMNTNPGSLWLRHFKNWQFIFDLGNIKLQNHFNSRSKCSLAPGLSARTRVLHQQIMCFLVFMELYTFRPSKGFIGSMWHSSGILQTQLL